MATVDFQELLLQIHQSMLSPNQMRWDVMSRLVPYTAASVDCVDTSTLVCFFGISGLWLQDRTIWQLKEEAQHLSKLGVRHVMWGLDGFDPGLSLATLHSPRHCFGVFVLVFLLLGVCYWLCYVQQLSTFMPKYLHGLQCSVVLPIYGGIIRYNVVYLFLFIFLSFIMFHSFSKRPGIST